MATMAVPSDNPSSSDSMNTFKLKPSPSKKSKMESAENSDDDEDYEPVLDLVDTDHSEELNIKLKSDPGTRSRKRPPATYRIGDMFNGLIPANKTGDLEERRPSSSTSTAGSSDKLQPKYQVETDVAVLARRKKQIDYGKNTTEYRAYSKTVPRENRESFHPRTPNLRRQYSRRAWDGLIKQWRKKLHVWSNAESLNGSVPTQPSSLNESFTSEESAEDRKVPVSELIQEHKLKANGDVADGVQNLKTEIKEESGSESVELCCSKIEKHEASWSDQVDDYYEAEYTDSEEDDNIHVKV